MKAISMKKLLFGLVAVLSVISSAIEANAITITNATNDKLKVGMYASLLNYSIMTFQAQETREYDSGIAHECVQKITINGTQVWAGTNCQNYSLTIQKKMTVPMALLLGLQTNLKRLSLMDRKA